MHIFKGEQLQQLAREVARLGQEIIISWLGLARTSTLYSGEAGKKGADDDLWRLGILLVTATQNKHNKNRKRVRNVAITLEDTLCTAGPLCGRCKVKNANSNTIPQNNVILGRRFATVFVFLKEQVTQSFK